MEEPFKTEVKRNPDGTFADNTAPGPGRPKGKTMKEFARDFLMNMSDEAKLEFLNSLSKDIVWKMAEGNPHNTEDITSKGEKIIPIYGGQSIQEHNGNSKDLPTQEENKSS